MRVCQIFRCTPDEAMKQNPAVVREIMEAMIAESAHRKMNSKPEQGGGAGSMNQSEADMYKKMLEAIENYG